MWLHICRPCPTLGSSMAAPLPGQLLAACNAAIGDVRCKLSQSMRTRSCAEWGVGFRRPQGVSDPTQTGILGSPACGPPVTYSVQLSYQLPALHHLPGAWDLLFNLCVKLEFGCHPSPSTGRTQHTESHGSANFSPPLWGPRSHAHHGAAAQLATQQGAAMTHFGLQHP